MTEADWLSCNDPIVMLDWLRSRGDVSRRKLRLFAAACCRRVWNLIPDECDRAVVEVIERVADGLATEAELEATRSEAQWLAGWFNVPYSRASATHATQAATDPDAVPRAIQAVLDAVRFAEEEGAWVPWEARTVLGVAAERARTQAAVADAGAALCRLLRDVFGPLPFRPLALDPGLLAWRGGTVPSIARSIADQGAFDRMPVLGDALEDAGCTDADILAHCRGRVDHVRGCWVADALLGRS